MEEPYLVGRLRAHHRHGPRAEAVDTTFWYRQRLDLNQSPRPETAWQARDEGLGTIRLRALRIGENGTNFVNRVVRYLILGFCGDRSSDPVDQASSYRSSGCHSAHSYSTRGNLRRNPRRRP
jgi:hypothetical protein